MPDASRARRPRDYDDFQETQQLPGPPDVPSQQDIALPMPASRPRHSPVAIQADPAPPQRDHQAKARLVQALDRQVLGERQRIADAVRAAHDAGVHDGERKAYPQGWRWGVVCGMVLGSLLVSIAFKLGLAS
jgi:hypothetical protein